MACEFIKYYTEPKKKYKCLSTSLFYKKSKYIKITQDLKTYNATDEKVQLFYNNLDKVNKLLLDGSYPDYIYFRIYYDKSIFEVDIYNELFERLKQNPKIQLIEYNCKNFKTLDDKHITLFGTLLRYHALFEEESNKIDYCVFVDCDNILTQNFFTIFEEFKKTKKLVYTVNKLNQINFNNNDYMENNDLFDFVYLLGGLTIIKKNRIFKYLYWDKYFNNMFDQNDLVYIFNYIDFKRFAFISLLNKEELKPQSYYSFNYGVDEIWLNYVIKKILIINNKKNQLDVYITSDYQLNFIVKRIIDLLTYNKIVNYNEFNLFLADCSFLKEKKYNDLINYINNLKKNNIIKFFNELKKNNYFKKIYIQNSIRYVINNINELINLRGKFNFDSILSSV